MIGYNNFQVKTSWELLRATASILKKNKKFLIYPAVSLFSLGVVLLTFVYPFIFKGGISHAMTQKVSINYYFYLFIFYLIANFITIFFNSALIAVVNKSLSGEDPGIMDGFADSLKHIRSLLVFAVLSSIVGILLHRIAEKFSWLGKIFAIAADLAWNMAVFFVLPVVVIKDEDIFTAIKSSASMMKKTWGEVLIGNFVVDAGLLSVTLIVMLIFAPITALLGFTNLSPAAFFTGTVGFCIVFVLSFSSSIFDVIYKIVLYRYVTTGKIEDGFKEEHLKSAFIPKAANNK